MSPEMRGHLAMLLFSVLVAGSFSLGALVANEIDPAALNAVRFLIAAVVIGGLANLTIGFERRYFHAPWRYLLLGGAFATFFVLMFEGLKTASPISISAMSTLMPLMSAGFGYLLLRQLVTPRMALALSVGAVGALWVIFRADLSALLQLQIGQGEMIFFWGCMAHALYTPLVRKLNRGEPVIVFSFGVMVAGLILLLAYGWRDVLATDWAGLPGIVLVVLLYLALITSAVTFVLLQFATLRLPAAKVMAYTYLTPSWVMLWEAALGNGLPSVSVFFGVALTALALFILLKNEEG
ncbi:MAG: EamA family transporter [Rhodobacterales bacterium]|nr:MAG: EamA family transporter [Rhodobacterales bacterium]